MTSISDKLDLLIALMDQQPEGEFVPIDRLSRNSEEFIEAIKYLIDFEDKPYEFNANYTKIRRYETYR
jgi:hypothetical protein